MDIAETGNSLGYHDFGFKAEDVKMSQPLNEGQTTEDSVWKNTMTIQISIQVPLH